jgi:hypothetical protein
VDEETSMNKWRVQYNNDTAQGDEFYWSWWEVTDDARTFKSSSEDDAQWLCDILNEHAS